MSGMGARLRRIESRVLVTEDKRQFERLKRSHFNLFQVSDAALMESLVSVLERKELPDWAENEFQAPIPHGSDKDRISEAEAWAHETMREAAGPTIGKQCTQKVHNSTITDAELAAHLNAVLGYIERSGFGSSKEYLSQLLWLTGEGSIVLRQKRNTIGMGCCHE